VSDLEQFDIAIVGAGPAGSRCAWRLASAGARVALVDGSHPREKPCGGGITGRALDIIRPAIDITSFDAVAIEDAWFEHKSNRVGISNERIVRVDGAGSSCAACFRDFDGALLAAATSAGARFLGERVTNVVADASGWLVSTRDRTIRAGWLVGADGSNSFVRRRVSAPFDRAGPLDCGSAFSCGASRRMRYRLRFEDRPAGYLWSFPRRDHLAVGICAQADESTAGSAGPAGVAMDCAQRLGRRRSDRTLRLGNPVAAGSERSNESEPPARGGCCSATPRGSSIRSRAKASSSRCSPPLRAADAVLAAGDAADTYQRHLRDSIYPELIRAARLKATFFRPNFTALLLRALAESAPIREIMIRLDCRQADLSRTQTPAGRHPGTQVDDRADDLVKSTISSFISRDTRRARGRVPPASSR
jgi:flavin-dependent dehydrogenase